MPWSALITAGGSILGGLLGSSGSSSAAKQSLTGYKYLTGPNGISGYVGTGNAANNAIASLLGIGGPGGGSSYVYSPEQQTQLQGIAGSLGAYNRSSAPNVQALIAAINSGHVTPDQINAILPQITGSNSHPDLAAALAQIGGISPTAATGGAAGNNAFNNYLNSAGYNFMLDQGQHAITGSAAARGMLNSGSTAKALEQYDTGLASQYFDNYLRQLSGLATSGLNASGQIGAAGTGGGANAAQYTNSGGNSLASGVSSAIGALNPALSNWFGGIGSFSPEMISVTPNVFGRY